MPCHDPYVTVIPGRVEHRVPVPCGRCAYCKKTRTDQWVFRLMQEDKVSLYAHFITLTYDTKNVPISGNGFMTLDKSHPPLFWKRLRDYAVRRYPHSRPIRYYLCGEYGSKNERPHYHAICFNVPDPELFYDSWKLGKIDVGEVEGASIAYTVGYMNKETRIPKFHRDDRVPEFAQMSKGIGKSYVSDMRNVNYHKDDYSRQYVTDHQGKKIPIPKYYKDRIFDDKEKAFIRRKSELSRLEREEEEKRLFFIKNPNATDLEWIKYMEGKKVVTYKRYYSKSKKIRKDV